MKYILAFLLLFIIGFMAVIIYKKYAVMKSQAPIKTPISTVAPFSLDTPPNLSLQGTILTLSKNVDFQSRSATEPARLTEKISVLQGEEFWTKDKGILEILFPNTLQITMASKTHINLVQTLPTNFVLLQDSGVAKYTKMSDTTPVGIRINHLLVQQNTGEVRISKEEDQPIITLEVLKGSITLAFNDTDNISNVLTVETGDTYIFDDEARTGELTTNE